MLKQRSGAIVHITSINSIHPIAGLMAYSAAKAALTNYSKALSRQVAPLGVRVNTVAPGFIETKGAQGLIEEMASSPALILVPHGRKS